MAKRKHPIVVAAAPIVASGGIVEGVADALPPDLSISGEALPATGLEDDVHMSDEAITKCEAILERREAKQQDILEDEEACDDIMSDPLVVAAKSGDRRQLLEALRDRLAVALVTTVSGRDIAAIARNLNIVSKELSTLPDPNAEGDDVDQMADMVKQMQA